jgi:hypothetical protein
LADTRWALGLRRGANVRDGGGKKMTAWPKHRSVICCRGPLSMGGCMVLGSCSVASEHISPRQLIKHLYKTAKKMIREKTLKIRQQPAVKPAVIASGSESMPCQPPVWSCSVPPYKRTGKYLVDSSTYTRHSVVPRTTISCVTCRDAKGISSHLSYAHNKSPVARVHVNWRIGNS